MGSGSLAAMSVFETGYKEDMNEVSTQPTLTKLYVVSAGRRCDQTTLAAFLCDSSLEIPASCLRAIGHPARLVSASLSHASFADEQEDAVKLVRDAILAGVFNDLGSGSNVDINVLRKDGTVKVMRGYMTPNEVAPFRAQYQRPKALDVPAGATAVLSTRFEPAGVVVSDVQPMVL